MFARRDFLYKRSHHGAHLGLAARDSAKQSSLQPDILTAGSASSVAKTTDPITPLSPVASVPATTTTPTTASSSTTPPLSTPTTPSPSSPSSRSSSSSQSLTSTSSSPASTAASISPTPLTLGSTPTTHAASGSIRVSPGISFTPTTSLSPSTTSSAGSSSGTNTGAVVGGVAGTLAGIAVLGFLLMWCMRRQRSRDVDDFDAQAFKRQSAMLVDDPADPLSYNPRPPTMIERHNASPALATQAGYGGQNFYGNYGGYGQQPPYAPDEMIQSAGSPPPQAYATPPMGYASYNDPQQHISRQPSNVGYARYGSQQPLARQPSNAAYLTRQPSSPAGYAPPTAPPDSFDPNAQYIDLNRSSVSAYQAAHYADISRQLGTTDPNGQVPRESSDLPEGPLPSPFDDPVAPPHVHLGHPSDVGAPGPVSATPVPQTQGNTTEAHQRPATVYDEGDAYGGI